MRKNDKNWKNEICLAIESWDSVRTRIHLNEKNINEAVDSDGRTPLMVLVDEYKSKTRKRERLNLYKKNNFQRLPELNDPKDLKFIADMMIEFGSDPEKKDNRGRNPILLAEPRLSLNAKAIDHVIWKCYDRYSRSYSEISQRNIERNTNRKSNRLKWKNSIMIIVGLGTMFMMWFVSDRFDSDLEWIFNLLR